jgi:hypothetical protein
LCINTFWHLGLHSPSTRALVRKSIILSFPATPRRRRTCTRTCCEERLPLSPESRSLRSRVQGVSRTLFAVASAPRLVSPCTGRVLTSLFVLLRAKVRLVQTRTLVKSSSFFSRLEESTIRLTWLCTAMLTILTSRTTRRTPFDSAIEFRWTPAPKSSTSTTPSSQSFLRSA